MLDHERVHRGRVVGGLGLAETGEQRGEVGPRGRAEPRELLAWCQTVREPWIRLVLSQANALELSYSKPESLRAVLPLTRCPLGGGAPFSRREMVLKCETYANLVPRRRLMAGLRRYRRGA